MCTCKKWEGLGLVQVENHQPFQGTPCRNYHTVIRTIASRESNNLNEISIIGPVPRVTTLYLYLPAANSPSEEPKKKTFWTGDFRRGHLHRLQFVRENVAQLHWLKGPPNWILTLR